MASSSIPRVAIIGGGITGTLAGMVLHHRGTVQPVVLEAGRRVGGRLLAGGGTPAVFRATHPSLVALYTQLAADGVFHRVVPPSDTNLRSRWGILGSSGGGFLPATQMPPPMASSTGEEEGQKKTSANVVDHGDFCHFLEGRLDPTFTCAEGTTAEQLCANLLSSADIETHTWVTVDQATPTADGWLLSYASSRSKGGKSTDNEKDPELPPPPTTHFDGLVVATHNPSFAASVVQNIAHAEQTAGDIAMGTTATEPPPVLPPLHRLGTDLQTVRTQGRQPVFTWRGRIRVGTNTTDTSGTNSTTTLPFDTVTVPGSPVVQFLTRHASSEEDPDLWTAVSTSTWASQVLDKYDQTTNADECLAHVQDVLTAHVQDLVQRCSSATTCHPVSVKRWNAAFTSHTLGASHAAVALQPWRLTIAGDYIAARPEGTTTTPLEAAALSGLAAGEQTAAYFEPPTGAAVVPPP